MVTLGYRNPITRKESRVMVGELVTVDGVEGRWVLKIDEHGEPLPYAQPFFTASANLF